MATDTMMSPLSVASQLVLDVEQSVTNGDARPQEQPMNERDDRSSSLSDLGDRGGNDGPDNELGEGSDVNDTEAETERLEDSPQKMRKHQNVVLTSTDHSHDDRRSSLAISNLPILHIGNGPHSNLNRTEATSEISSPADSGEEIGKALSTTPSSSRKRKRSSFEQDSMSDRGSPPEPSIKATPKFRSTSAGALLGDPYSGESVEEDDQEIVLNTTTVPVTETQLEKFPDTASPQPGFQSGKRKGMTTNDEDLGSIGNESPRAESPARLEYDHDVIYSNEEDENQEVEDVRQADNAVKTEETLAQKRAALESLNAMEKCFARLRDKLFDERLAQCNEELAMLESAIPTHPELLAMKDVIDQRRDQKIQYEHNLLKYKLQTLQRESVANKAQAHSQYMQTVREIRDSHLEQLNKDFYQLQRERRNVEGDVPDYIFSYNPKRSQQVTQQTAYNMEVSILSGIAKYIGFPAAPDLRQARPKEVEDDLRSMGISTASHNHPPLLRAASSFARQKSTPDEHFLEQNPWANPQHPSHHQPRQPIQRQLSALSRTVTPTTAPAAQRRIIDLTEPQGSASTIPDHPSGPNSSIAATPATAEVTNSAQPRQSLSGKSIIDQTPSRITGSLLEVATGQNKISQAKKSEQTQSPSLPKATSQDTQAPGSLPKPLPFVHTGGSSSTPALRTSTPGRYTIIKAENPIQSGRHSSMPRYHTPPVSTVGNGLMNRHAA